MDNKNSLPQRKSPRLAGYDYASEGVYFVTICTHQRQHLFGDVRDDTMILSKLGNLVQEIWLSIPSHKSNVILDDFVVMPNHFHGLIVLDTDAPLLGTIIAHFKSAVTRTARQKNPLIDTIWQTRYHDHIVRNEEKLNFIRQYIQYNPAKWAEDTFYQETYL